MINDFFTKEETYPILDFSQSKIGTNVVTYKVLKLLDTKNLMDSNTYSVSVKHRILVSGSSWQPGGSYQAQGFQNYPIMMTVQSGIKNAGNSNPEITLKRIFPKTINASVEQSSNNSTGTSNSQTKQNSSGSSLSNINTFGIDLSMGFFGEAPVGSVGFSYSHSQERTSSHSASMGSESAKNAQATSGNEMSVKDWAAYSSIQNLNQTSQDFMGEYIQWDWGQAYPWNIFEYSETGSGSDILLPEDVVSRLLYYGTSDITTGPASKNILLPPSDLSLFGLDFTMAAEWQVTFPDPLTALETLQFEHRVNVIHGSHFMQVPAGGGQATLTATLGTGYLNPMPQPAPMDLGQYALVPLLEGQRDGTGIGFQSNLFDLAPTSAASDFKIRSRGNDLLVTGQGFAPGMSAAFPASYSGTGATLTIAFKVADVRTQYALILKHWIGAGGNIILTCSINGNTTVINVADPEGQGSLNNINQLELRNFDLKSSNYHDYLVLGWNEIKITIMPSNSALTSEYIISALSVEG